ncbi:hypothetical protein BHE74_00055168 [Ensete ventricosum]|nr:hypothetical protein BHE74_00055168 [Ensete ventricosum]
MERHDPTPFGLLCLVEQLVPCSAPVNALARLRLFANIVPTTPFKFNTLLDIEGCSGDCISKESQSSKCIYRGRTRHKLFNKTEYSVLLNHLRKFRRPPFPLDYSVLLNNLCHAQVVQQDRVVQREWWSPKLGQNKAQVVQQDRVVQRHIEEIIINLR